MDCFILLRKLRRSRRARIVVYAACIWLGRADGPAVLQAQQFAAWEYAATEQLPNVAAAPQQAWSATPPGVEPAFEPAISTVEFQAVLKRLETAERELLLLSESQAAAVGGVMQASAAQPLQAAPEVAPLPPPGAAGGGQAGGSGSASGIFSDDFLDTTPEEFYGGGATTSGRPTVRVRGRILGDTLYADQDADNIAQVGPVLSSFAFRQARLGAQGEAYDNMIYQVDMEFADVGRPSFRSTYFGVTDVPFFGVVYAGFVKESFSLEQMPSIEHISFMERSPASALAPGRSTGIKFQNNAADMSMTYSMGVFYDGSDEFGNHIGGSNRRAVTGRFTWLPYYDEPSEGRYLVHVGASFSVRKPQDDVVDIDSRPEVQAFRNFDNTITGVPNFVNTGGFAADGVTVLGTEAAVLYGPLLVQAEYNIMNVSRPAAGGADVTFWGAYVQAGYFLTGEHRPYDRVQAQFSRVRPFERFFLVEGGREANRRLLWGTGAWEVSARLSHLDVDDGVIAGGKLTDATFGVNWYWNPRTRMQFDYVHAMLDRNGLEGTADLFATRFMFSF